jgi:hypothetical protein
MKNTISILFGSIVVLAVAMLLWPTMGSPAQAQSGCKPFEAIVHATLPTSAPLALDDSWGGHLYGVLGGALSNGILSGNDGSETWRGHFGNMGQGRLGLYTVGFNCAPATGGTYFTDIALSVCTDSFTYQVPHAVFPSPPGQGGLMFYMGNTAKIVAGTGKFKSAFGNLNVKGPAIAWQDTDLSNLIGWLGRWSPELSGQVCGIQQ